MTDPSSMVAQMTAIDLLIHRTESLRVQIAATGPSEWNVALAEIVRLAVRLRAEMGYAAPPADAEARREA